MRSGPFSRWRARLRGGSPCPTWRSTSASRKTGSGSSSRQGMRSLPESTRYRISRSGRRSATSVKMSRRNTSRHAYTILQYPWRPRDGRPAVGRADRAGRRGDERGCRLSAGGPSPAAVERLPGPGPATRAAVWLPRRVPVEPRRPVRLLRQCHRDLTPYSLLLAAPAEQRARAHTSGPALRAQGAAGGRRRDIGRSVGCDDDALEPRCPRQARSGEGSCGARPETGDICHTDGRSERPAGEYGGRSAAGVDRIGGRGVVRRRAYVSVGLSARADRLRPVLTRSGGTSIVGGGYASFRPSPGRGGVGVMIRQALRQFSFRGRGPKQTVGVTGQVYRTHAVRPYVGT